MPGNNVALLIPMAALNIRTSEDQNENIRKTEKAEDQRGIVPRHEKLWIWQKAHKLAIQIFEICKKLPLNEHFRLSDQIQRSSKSVADNIAEGNSSYYFNDKIKTFYISRKEAAETQNHIREMESKKYIDPISTNELIYEYEQIIRGINGLINKVRKQKEFFQTKGNTRIF